VKKIIFAALAAGALVACQDKSQPSPATSGAEDVATQEDFEDEATSDISVANFTSELDKLAAEIDAN
jgi:hypothetical protein